MAIQEAHEHGWCDDAEQTDPRDGETDQRDEKRKNFVHALPVPGPLPLAPSI
jgi:Ni,Fe-hydrogenase I large subunit